MHLQSLRMCDVSAYMFRFGWVIVRENQIQWKKHLYLIHLMIA